MLLLFGGPVMLSLDYNTTMNASFLPNALDNKHRSIIEFSPLERPVISVEAFVAPSATVAGKVELWDKSSVWYDSVIRGTKSLTSLSR